MELHNGSVAPIPYVRQQKGVIHFCWRRRRASVYDSNVRLRAMLVASAFDCFCLGLSDIGQLRGLYTGRSDVGQTSREETAKRCGEARYAGGLWGFEELRRRWRERLS